jgi:hypothetical protein
VDQDFLVYQLRVLSSLTPNVPLSDNLRAVMATFLAKLRDACRAEVAIHVFVNVELHELHAIVVGCAASTAEALRKEMFRRHGGSRCRGFTPEPTLPNYRKFDGGSTQETSRLFKKAMGEEYAQTLSDRLFSWINEVVKGFPDEWSARTPARGDTVIVIPLGTSPYSRFGYILLWSPGTALAETAKDQNKREQRVVFRNGIEQLLVQVFANFYRMEPQTYLPSFCQPAAKKVTLLCAELWNFERIADIIRRRDDPSFDHERKILCLRSLVNRFTSVAAGIVERHHGRVDQIWGSGLLAVFGEYVDTPDASPRPGGKRAAIAASQIVSEFRGELNLWLAQEFEIRSYRENYSEAIKIAPVASIDYGEVLFEYVGSKNQRVFMAFGERVSFVRKLATIAGTARFSQTNGGSPLEQTSIFPQPGFTEGPPILLSQPAHEFAIDVLKDRPGHSAYEFRVGHSLGWLGSDRDFVVFPIYPENVRTEIFA